MPLLSSDSPDAQVLKAVLDTLTSLSSHSLLGRSEHIDLLISCACTDAREEIKCHALNNLVQLQDGQIGLKKRQLLVCYKQNGWVMSNGHPANAQHYSNYSDWHWM